MKHTVKLWAFRAWAYPIVGAVATLDWLHGKSERLFNRLCARHGILMARRDFFRDTTS